MAMALIAALLLVACASGTAGGDVIVSTCGATTRLHKGETLVVRLSSQVTTGYVWSLAAQSAGILKAAGEPEIERRDGDVDGGTEVQVFRFTTPSTGSDVLTFHNKRPWEKDKPPLKTCTITVEAEE